MSSHNLGVWFKLEVFNYAVICMVKKYKTLFASLISTIKNNFLYIHIL